MKMKMKIRLFSILFCIVMLLCMIPTTVLANNEITYANITITKPVGGETPDFNPVSSDPEKYYAEVDGWGWMYGSTVTPMGAAKEFKALERYDLRVIFHPKTGYTFAENCVFTINGKETGRYGIDSNEFRYTYLYAADPLCPTYTVTFEANGGSGTMVNLSGIFDNYELPWNEFKAPAGKFFIGWWVNSYLKDPGDVIHVLSDTTLMAGWKNIPSPGQGYTVTFDANGGEGTMEGKTDFYGPYNLPECGFTAPDGKQFKGWMVNGDGVIRKPNDKINITLNANVAPIWENIPKDVNTIYSVTMSIPEPVAGETINTGIIQREEKYNVSILWSTVKDKDISALPNTHKFEAGKTYYADFYLVSEDPYVYAESTSIFINDKKYTAVWTLNENYKKYITVYDVPFAVSNNSITAKPGAEVSIDEDKKTASLFKANLNPDDILGLFENEEKLRLLAKDGTPIADSALVSTGSKIQLVINGEIIDELTIIIRGDIDGNGIINSDDAIYLLRNTLFETMYPVIVEDDVDGNGKYNSDDAIHLLRHTLFPSMYPLK